MLRLYPSSGRPRSRSTALLVHQRDQRREISRGLGETEALGRALEARIARAVEQLFSLHERGHRDFALSLDKLAIPDTKARVCAESVSARITA